MRLREIVTEFVHENLVAGIDGPPGDDLAALVTCPGNDFEVLPQRVGGSVDQEILPLADDAGEGEEEAELPGNDLLDLVVLG